jgi:hypothetical protein
LHSHLSNEDDERAFPRELLAKALADAGVWERRGRINELACGNAPVRGIAIATIVRPALIAFFTARWTALVKLYKERSDQ